MPLTDRDYMRPSSPPPRRAWSGGSPGGFWNNPVWAIIFLNFLFFIVTSISSNAFLNLGLIPAEFLKRPWTLVTAMFVHAGFGHIIGNMITLYFFGTFFSRLVGQGRFLAVYFGGGIAGGILYLLLGEPVSILVGASGAVFALAGAMVMMVPKLRVMVYFIVPMPLWVVVIIFFGLWSIPGFVSPSIGWQAHLGGLVSGIIAGYFLRRAQRRYYYR